MPLLFFLFRFYLCALYVDGIKNTVVVVQILNGDGIAGSVPLFGVGCAHGARFCVHVDIAFFLFHGVCTFLYKVFCFGMECTIIYRTYTIGNSIHLLAVFVNMYVRFFIVHLRYFYIVPFPLHFRTQTQRQPDRARGRYGCRVYRVRKRASNVRQQRKSQKGNKKSRKGIDKS